MDLISQTLFAAGGLIYFVLGTAHLVYTFFTPRFRPFDQAVEEAMKGTSPRLTRHTTMWKAWMGFNGSHSTGAMFFGFIIFYFAIANLAVLKQSILLQGVVLIHSLSYVYLGRNYWFNIPNNGIALATLCFVFGLILIYLA